MTPYPPQRSHSLLLPLLLVVSGCGEGSLDPSAAADTFAPEDPGSATADPSDGETEGDVGEAPVPEALPPLPPVDERPGGDVDRPDYIDSTGFFVAEGRVYDTFNNDFVFRGVNNAHIWFDTFGRLSAFEALDSIAAYGYNSVRIVWETTRDAEGADPALLRTIIRRVIELEMVPMVELHDVTGDETTEGLLRMAEYYARPDVKEVLIEFEPYLSVNIANEWSGEDNFLDAYLAAVQLLRDNGINHMLVIDGNGFGQNAPSVLDNGQALLDADPQHNLLFSVHMYGTYAGGQGTPRITQVLEQAVASQLPLIIGEFGWQVGNATNPEVNFRSVEIATIMAECTRLGLGYFPWSWKGNGPSVAYLDMSIDWAGNSLTTWGLDLQNDPNGIEATSQKASVFLLAE